MKSILCASLIGCSLLMAPAVTNASTPVTVKLTLSQYKILRHCSPLISAFCNRMWVRYSTTH